jgi:hydrogenase expression/formation protein HypE
MSKIEIGHGSGGRLTRDLVTTLFLKYLNCDELKPLEDAASVILDQQETAITTDSYVVRPLFFPGGDIGKLAISGTVNDLLVSGAVPRYLSMGFIIEEGFLFSDLENILRSINKTAQTAGVKVVAGDTKVVEKNKCDGMFINTTGLGSVVKPVSADSIEAGDSIIVTGTIGDHGTSIALARNEFNIEAPVESDCAPLNELLTPVFRIEGLRWMRDPTRGGLATVLAEVAESTGFGMLIFEESMPVRKDVHFIAEMLGYDPLYLANEGKAVIITSSDTADSVLKILREHPLGKDSQVIGSVTSQFNGARLKTRIGGERVLDLLEEEMLPRIC